MLRLCERIPTRWGNIAAADLPPMMPSMLRRRPRLVTIGLLIVAVVLLARALDLTGGNDGPFAASPKAADTSGPLGAADGVIPDASPLSPFAHAPALDRLQPRLRAALRAAATAARADGITLQVTSGWRSARYQRALLQRAIVTYGSRREARRYVSTPKLSAHVRGQAVDIGPTDADDWLMRNGTRFGLCRTYANEIWHFERATTPGGECPPQRPDASDG
jgi:hypothetical protein